MKVGWKVVFLGVFEKKFEKRLGGCFLIGKQWQKGRLLVVIIW